MKKLSEEKLILERERLEKLKIFENKYKDYIIAGVDEAGRGPLAGPVVSGCVVLDKNKEILFLNDSKKLSEKTRKELFTIIKKECLAYGIGIVDEKIIDKVNILQATYIAMREAIDNCNQMLMDRHNKNISCLLVDAVNIPNIDIKQVGIVKGDALSVSIASSSILAKVTRDDIMEEYDKKYPEYKFIKHKGYGTKLHMDILKEIGPCEIHRKTFLKFLQKEEI